MPRTEMTAQNVGGDDAMLGAGLTWNSIDRVNQNVISEPSKKVLIVRTAVAAVRTMRLVSTQKGVTVQKDFSIPSNAAFGQQVIDFSKLDTGFWGKHGASDPGDIYIDWPDSAANSDVQYGLYNKG